MLFVSITVESFNIGSQVNTKEEVFLKVFLYTHFQRVNGHYSQLKVHPFFHSGIEHLYLERLDGDGRKGERR